MSLQKTFYSLHESRHFYLKLYTYGVRGTIYDSSESNLCNRYQFACLGKINSTVHCYSLGVPQGSDFSPLLFLFYVKDICNAVTNGKVELFVDDTNLIVGHVNILNV